ncbi:CYTH domain-containing protein [Rossellomorea aquimaris]|uniref:CYTH domain-containing protein n=1 Tax=Rossellomorea aquimaris TaxID=189382 RepID=UPI000AA5D705
MAQEIEIEFKNLLTEDEFDALTSHFKIPQSEFKSQDNHYLDTPLFLLKDQSSALRIREKNDEFTLTLKTPLEEGLLETNQPLSHKESLSLLKEGEFPDGEVKDVLNMLSIPISSLEHFGTLTTNRAEIEYRGGLLVFDQSSYLNKVDFELEYEVTNREFGEKIFLELLQELSIPVRKTENKIKRFYREKIKQTKK